MNFRTVLKMLKLAILGFWVVVIASAGFAIVDPVRATIDRPATGRDGPV